MRRGSQAFCLVLGIAGGLFGWMLSVPADGQESKPVTGL